MRVTKVENLKRTVQISLCMWTLRSTAFFLVYYQKFKSNVNGNFAAFFLSLSDLAGT